MRWPITLRMNWWGWKLLFVFLPLVLTVSEGQYFSRALQSSLIGLIWLTVSPCCSRARPELELRVPACLRSYVDSAADTGRLQFRPASCWLCLSPSRRVVHRALRDSSSSFCTGWERRAWMPWRACWRVLSMGRFFRRDVVITVASRWCACLRLGIGAGQRPYAQSGCMRRCGSWRAILSLAAHQLAKRGSSGRPRSVSDIRVAEM
mmetsp:Transcript_15134/g.61911  ORF Transcript_15134/g.61911 Transcript_15134/m.61911 type:complete len:206 (+) Transcript_15134:3735-4352(+)